MIPLIRPHFYVGRQSQKETLLFWSREIATEKRCRALVIEAAGGLGKTRLLEDYPLIVQANCPELRIARIIDLYDFANRSPDAIEQRLIAGLQQSQDDQWYRLAPDEFATCFQSYLQAYTAYVQARAAANDAQLQHLRAELRDQFVSSWNQLAARHPLVMRFDTIETLFSQPAPDEALVSVAATLTGAGQVLDWMRQVLPRLQYTLVILSGRPLSLPANPVIDQLRQLDLVADTMTLGPFDSSEETDEYLQAYTINLPKDEVQKIRQITEGRPLLLTCYAEINRPVWAVPPSLPISTTIADRSSLENQIIDTILNPIDRPSLAERTLVYCLFFLAYARRGLRREDLRELFQRLGFTEYDDAVIVNLDALALVKKALSWWSPAAVTCLEAGQQQADDTLLFLHDEIYQLIDESAMPSALGLREPTLDYLCMLSRQQVQQSQGRAELFRTMSDHVYYELTRNIVGGGYRAYTIYVDWLLREREVEAAVILSDVFWSTLTSMVSRGERQVQPYRNALSQSELTYAEILRDEQVRQVKFLRARDQNVAAAELAEQLYQKFVHNGLIPSDQHEVTVTTLAHGQYLFVDFTLARAIAIIYADPAGREYDAAALFSRVITFLEPAVALRDSLLRLRRWYFLGLAYTFHGQLRYQQQRFAEAISDAEQGRIAFKRYREERSGDDSPPLVQLNDRIDPDVAQAINNLAYNLALSGNLKRAIRLSTEVVERYGAVAPTYRQALFYNTKGLIHMRLGEYLEAQNAIVRAEQAALYSGSQRARGLVADARGQLEREMMVARQEPDPAIISYFEEAIQLLHDEPRTLQEVYYNWASLMRSLAALYRAQQQPEQARQCNQRALELLDESLALLPEQAGMQRANLLQSKAATFHSMQEYAPAVVLLDEAETMMDQPMPEYGQVVCGRIAMQRGLVLLDDAQDYPAGLRMLVIALARVYLFARQHRDQKAFEQLIERQIKRIPDDALVRFKQTIESGQLHVKVADLAYQRPASDHWDNEWNYSVRYINECIATQLDL